MAARRIIRTFPPDAKTFFAKFPSDHVFQRLPMHYKKQLIDFHDKPRTPVHYIPDPRPWYKDPDTGRKVLVQNWPLKIIFPKASHEGLWGGEGIVQGFKAGRGKTLMFQQPSFRRSHIWVPSLKKVVLYSEILDKYMSVVVTERTLTLIHENYGLDFYILKTELVDLQSRFGFKLRRMMLRTLANKDMYHDDPVKQAEIYDKYKHCLVPEEEIDWVGLTLDEALKKQTAIENEAARRKEPLKYKYRKELIEKLNTMETEEVKEPESSGGWLQRIFPFSKSGKSKETTTESS